MFVSIGGEEAGNKKVKMEILEAILKDKSQRKQLIAEFQQMIWSDENANEILSELAYDLDFYEEDIQIRNEDKSYFGEERLKKEIIAVLEKLKI